MLDDEKESSKYLPTFDGMGNDREEKFQLWLVRFEAYASWYGFEDAIGDVAEADLPLKQAVVKTLDPTKDADKKALAAVKRNRKAVVNLTMAMSTTKSMAVVYDAKTPDWPSGLAWKIMKALKAKYMPMDMMTEVELRTQLNKVHMTKNSDPKDLFEKLASIRNRYVKPGKTIAESELIAVVMAAAPEKYKSLLISTQALKGTHVTIDDLEVAMTQHYRSSNHGKDGGDEIALISCFSCGEEGHKSHQCTKKKGHKNTKGKSNGKSAGRFTGKCNECGTIGHKAADCWEKSENASKRPSNWRSKKNGESANVNVDSNELLLSSIDLEDGTAPKKSYVEALLFGLDSSDANTGSSEVLIDCCVEDSIAIEEPVVVDTMWTGRPNYYAVLCDNDDDEEGEELQDEVTGSFRMPSQVARMKKRTPIVDDEPREFLNQLEIDLEHEQWHEVGLSIRDLTFPKSIDLLRDPNVWVGDTGATTHSTPFKAGMMNKRKANAEDNVTVGSGANVKAGMIGDIPGTIHDQYGKEVTTATLKDVTYLEGGRFNLYSMTRKMKEGWNLGGNKDSMWLERNGAKIVFDIAIPTKKGMIFAMYFRRGEESLAEIGAVEVDEDSSSKASSPSMSIKEMHAKCAHINEDATRQVAKALGVTLKRGTLGICADCSRAKAKQKNVSKNNTTHVAATKPGERVFLDITSVKPPDNKTHLGKRHMRMMVDEYSGCTFADFYETKSGMIEPTCAQFQRWEQAGKCVAKLRMDNGGENTKLLERVNSAAWKLNIEAEFTARDTPQQNHLAELAIADTAARGRALLAAANVPTKYRYKLFRSAFETASKVGNLRTRTVNGKLATRYEHFMGANPSFAQHLRTWGEAGTVKLKSKKTAKIADRGEQCMFIGYPKEHTGDTYMMWNPTTGRVHITRDVTWLRRMFFSSQAINAEVMTQDDAVPALPTGESGVDDSIYVPQDDVESSDDAKDSDHEDSDGDEDNDMPSSADSDSADEARKVTFADDDDEPIRTRSGRSVNPPKKYLDEIGGVHLTPAEEHFYQKMFDGEIACVGAGIGGGFNHTSELHVMKYDQAMASPDRDEWNKAVEAEHENLKHYNVFKPVLKSELPKGTKVIKSTWAMKKKANGKYKARITARGFEQIDGKHFQSHNVAAPVVNEITIRVIFVLMIMMQYVGELLDVKGAFLHGDFEEGEQVHMEVPKGFDKWYDPRLYVLLLLQTLYGLRNAAMAYWKKLLQCFHNMGYKRSQVDPCLYFKWVENSTPIFWVSWVDDCLFACPEHLRDQTRGELTSRFDCDIVGNMDEYVGCKIDRNMEEGWIRITQPVILQSFIDEFDLPQEGQEPSTPGEPGKCLMPVGESEALLPENQTLFRKGVGKLMHVMRWSRPDNLNAVRDLSKYMKEASERHIGAMKRTMRHILSTRNRGLFLKPTRKWNGDPKFEFRIKGRSDSTYASDQTTMRSVTGTTVFLEDAPVAMKCFQQKTVTLSSAEAELMAAVTCAQDMLYVMRLVQSMGLQVELPMILQVDNIGAVGIANNWSVGGRTRHVDARLHFLRELKEQGLLLTEWLSGDEMSSDLLTKNLPKALHEKHTKAYCGEDEYYQEYMRKRRDSKGESVGG